jgi:hypothetical protein
LCVSRSRGASGQDAAADYPSPAPRLRGGAIGRTQLLRRHRRSRGQERSARNSITLVSAGGNIPAAAAIVVAQKIRNFPMRCRDLSAMTRDRSCMPVVGTGFAKQGLGIFDSGRNRTTWNQSGTIRMM